MLGRKTVAIPGHVLAVATQEHTDEPTDRRISSPDPGCSTAKHSYVNSTAAGTDTTNPDQRNCNATHFGIQIAINALWSSAERFFIPLNLHREQQREIRRRHDQTSAFRRTRTTCCGAKPANPSSSPRAPPAPRRRTTCRRALRLGQPECKTRLHESDVTQWGTL